MISEAVTTKISISKFSHPCSKFLATTKVGLAWHITTHFVVEGHKWYRCQVNSSHHHVRYKRGSFGSNSKDPDAGDGQTDEQTNKQPP